MWDRTFVLLANGILTVTFLGIKYLEYQDTYMFIDFNPA